MECLGGCAWAIRKHCAILQKGLELPRFWYLGAGGTPGTVASRTLRDCSISSALFLKLEDRHILHVAEMSFQTYEIINKFFFRLSPKCL